MSDLARLKYEIVAHLANTDTDLRDFQQTTGCMRESTG